MKKLYCIVIYCITGLSVPVYSQANTCVLSLSGKISGEDAADNMCYSTVTIAELNQSILADASGFFRFDGLCKGNYTLICSHLGFTTSRTAISLDTNRVVHIELAHSINALPDAEVSTEHTELSTTQSATELVGSRLDSKKGSDLTQLLDGMTGISALKTGGNISKPVIHGLHSKRIIIMNNGVRQEGQQWGLEHAPEIDPYSAKKITVIKGADGVRYGPDAIAGVILVEPAPLRNTPGTRGEINLAGFSNGWKLAGAIALEGSTRKQSPFAWRVQASYRRGGNISTPNYILKNTGTEDMGVSAAVGYIKEKYSGELYVSLFRTRTSIFSGSHIGNLTDLMNAINAPEPPEKSGFSYTIGRPYQDVTHLLTKTTHTFKTGKNSRLNVVGAFQYNRRKEYDKHVPLNDSLAALNKPALDFLLATATLDVNWDHKIGRRFRGMIGANTLYQENTWNGNFFIPNFRNILSGVYWIEKFAIGKIELEGGIRADHNFMQVFMYENGQLIRPIHQYINMAANAGVIVKPVKNFIVRINYSTAWRPPSVNEMYSNGLHHASASVEIGDRNIRPERAHNLNLEVSYENPWFKGSVLGYVNFINDFIYLRPTLPATLTVRGAFPTFRYEQTDALIGGMDADIRFLAWKKLSIYGKASLVRGWNRSLRDWLIMMPADKLEGGIQYNFKSGKRIKNAYVNISVTGVFRQTRVPDSSDYLPPPPGYVLLRAGAGGTIMIGKQSLEIYLEANNILNTRYREYLDRFRYFHDAQGYDISLRIRLPLDFSKKS